MHEDWFWHSGNIKVITSTVWEVVVLVYLREGFLKYRLWDGLRLHDNYNQFTHSSNIKRIISTFWEAIVLVLLIIGIYNVRHWHGLRWHCKHIPSFTKIDKGVQAILRFCLRNLRGCNVGITDGRDLRSTAFRWLHMAWYSYHISWRLVKAFNQY
jgi:hypothetical protein